MKIKRHESEFKPVTLTLEIQTQEELDWLVSIFNCCPVSEDSSFETFEIFHQLLLAGARITKTLDTVKRPPSSKRVIAYYKEEGSEKT